MRSIRLHRFAVIAGLSAISLGMVLAILYENHGILTYAIDDSYIHLVMARSIAAGHYGYNLGEASSPDSSIAFPFLLAPLVWAGLGTAAPLVVNIIALLVIAYLLHRWLTDEMEATPLAASLLTLGVVFGLNLLNMALIGMEHCVQVLFGFLVCRGIVRIDTNRRPAGWTFWPAVVIGPLVRYELLAISLVAIAFVAWRTRRFAAPMLAAAAVCATVGGFGAYLALKGLWWLPASVIAKSVYFDRATVHTAPLLLTNFLGNAETQPGTVMVALAALSVAAAIRRPERIHYAVIAMLWLLAELVAGQVGWYRRYEVWALTSLSFLAIGAWSPISDWERSVKPFLLAAAATCAVLVTSPYIRLVQRIPLAANNIYNQQYQMGLIVQRLGVRSVAVNDIGLVAWSNPGVYVLDMAGLASQEVLAHRRCCPDNQAWIEDVARRHGVELILIYDTWVAERPASWTKIGELELLGKRVTPAGSIVSIYGATPESARILAPKLAAFTSELPSQARLSVVSSAQAFSQ